jgi:hypothetical protein
LLVDHLPLLLPQFFKLLSGAFEFLGFVSAAEGFVFVSGYISAIVFTRVRRESGVRAVWKKTTSRALTIYATYVVATALVVLLVQCGGTAQVSWGPWRHLFAEPFAVAAIRIASLLWQPSFLEILPMYAVLIFAAPLVLGQLDRGRYWLVALSSVSLWGLSLLGFREQIVQAAGLQIAGFGYFNSFSWQILYVGGLICGHKSLSGRSSLSKSIELWLAAVGLSAVFLLHRHGLLMLPIPEWWVGRSALGPLRLLNFLCVAFLFARFRDRIGRQIKWEGFAFLSRHSLQVFAFHLILIYLCALVFDESEALLWWQQLVFTALNIAGLFYIAWVSGLFKTVMLRASARSHIPGQLTRERQVNG